MHLMFSVIQKKIQRICQKMTAYIVCKIGSSVFPGKLLGKMYNLFLHEIAP